MAMSSMISIFLKGKTEKKFRAVLLEGRSMPASLEDTLISAGIEVSQNVLELDAWRFQDINITNVFKRLSTGLPSLRDIVGNNIYYGIKTGLNEAFFISSEVKQKLIADDARNTEIIKPIRTAQHLRTWYQLESYEHLIFTRHGIDISQYPVIENYLKQYRTKLEPKPDNWEGRWPGRKSGPYQWYEIQDQVRYFEEFNKPKILWPNISKFPRFSWDEVGLHVNDAGAIIVWNNLSLLALLNSRATWFCISQIASPSAIRDGLWRYQPKIQFVERLPIPELTAGQESQLAEYAEQITGLARQRYQLHEDMRQTIINEFNGDTISTRVALYEWWNFEDEKALNDEIKRNFQAEIPLSKRAEWRGFLNEQKAEHERLTGAIIELEIALNDVVYAAFDLTPEEIRLIEEATRYPYGAV